MSPKAILSVHALLLVAGGAYAALTAPEGSKVVTAWAVPGGCAALLLVCAVFASTWGKKVGTLLAFAFALVFAWRAWGAHQKGKESLANVLAALAAVSAVSAGLLVRPPKRRDPPVSP